MLGINVFEDKTFWYVQKKSQKIVEAIYMVTQNIKDNEPLRTALRSRSVRLLEVITESYSFGHKDRELSARRVSICLTEILAVLDVAVSVRFISTMNHAIIRHEVAHLIAMLAERYLGEDRAAEGSLDTSFFKETTKLVEYLKDRSSFGSHVPQKAIAEGGKSSSPLHVRMTLHERSPFHSLAAEKQHVGQKHAIREEGTSAERNSIGHSQGHDLQNKSLRKATILSFIKDKGTVSIKDIVSVVTDCSEKTIQRELLSLVEEGVLTKTGERRWSVYSLVKA